MPRSQDIYGTETLFSKYSETTVYIHTKEEVRFLLHTIENKLTQNVSRKKKRHKCKGKDYMTLRINSIIPFSSHFQSFPESGSFQMSQFFASGGQSIGVSASASVLPMNIQNWFTLGWTGLISLQSKGLSRVFSNTTVGKHQFLGTQPTFWSNSHIHTWLLEKP